jgi:hypothetical protein
MAQSSLSIVGPLSVNGGTQLQVLSLAGKDICLELCQGRPLSSVAA